MTAYSVLYLAIFYFGCFCVGSLAGCFTNFFMNRSFWPFLVRRHWAKTVDQMHDNAVHESHDELSAKLFQAFQVLGCIDEWIAGGMEKPPEEEFIRAMDYFSADDFDEDFLPWPRVIQKVEAETVQ